MLDPQVILRELDAIRAETLKRLDGLTQAQLDWRPAATSGEEAWSLGEVFMHLAIDEHYLREQIARPLLEGYGRHESFHHKQLDALIAQVRAHEVV